MSLQSRIGDLITSIGTAFKADRARLDALEGSYEEGTFSPGFTFVTPGDLAVAYAAQNGHYVRIGDTFIISIDITFTPTYGTAAGRGRITGLPRAHRAGHVTNMPLFFGILSTYDTGDSQTFAQIQGNVDYMDLYSVGNADGRSDLDITTFPSGAVRVFRINGMYRAAA